MGDEGKIFEEYLSATNTPKLSERISVFNKSGSNQQKLLDSKVKKDLANKNVDTTVAKKLFQYWIHILTGHLSSEQKKMLCLFNVPEEPDNEVDYLKYITALNIVSSSSVSLRIVKVVGSIVNAGLVFSLGKACIFLGNYAFENKSDQINWDKSVQGGLTKLASVLADPTEMAQLSNDVISSRIQEYYEKSKTHNEIKLYPTSPFYSMLSKVLENSVTFFQDVISESGILSSDGPYKTDLLLKEDSLLSKLASATGNRISEKQVLLEGPSKKLKVF